MSEAAVAFSALPEYAALDAETKGYFDNRGLSAKTPLEVALTEAKAHRELQRHIGAPADQIIKLPKDMSDEAAMRAVYQRLGAGQKPEDYDFSNVVKFSDGSDELDPDFINGFRELALKTGMTKAQAAEAVKFARDYAEKDAKTTATQTATQRQAATEAGRAELAKSWGANARTNQYLAEQAAEKLGLTEAQVHALDDVMGFVPVRNLLLQVGKGLGEAKFVSGAGGSDKSLTREGATEEIANLMKDEGFMKKYLVDGDAQAKKQWDALHRIAYAA